MASIIPITMELALGYRSALDVVARERRYLRLTEAPSIESTLAFVAGNLAKGNPHFIAVEDGQVVGWCDISRADHPAESHSGQMGMGLLPNFRGRGLGKALLASALAAARHASFHRVALDVYSTNTIAIRLYETMGFEREGLLRDAHQTADGYRDIVLMALLLDAPKR